MSQYTFKSYESMVKMKLDSIFEILNKTAINVGIEWYVVPGHYWLEVRILPMKKKKVKPLFNEENRPVAEKINTDSKINQSSVNNQNKSKMGRPEPMMNNIVSDESEKPDIFSNPLSSVHNDLQ